MQCELYNKSGSEIYILSVVKCDVIERFVYKYKRLLNTFLLSYVGKEGYKQQNHKEEK